MKELKAQGIFEPKILKENGSKIEMARFDLYTKYHEAVML
jgi:hypothetical protein